MNYQQALAKLEKMQEILEAQRTRPAAATQAANKAGERAQLIMLYGELEEVIERFGGVAEIEIQHRHAI